MIAIYLVLGILVFVVMAFIAVGLYEFIVEDKEFRRTNNLYLKHLDDINHGK